MKYEIQLDQDNLYSLYYTTIKGFFSVDTNIEISYDIYDKHQNLIEDAITQTFTITTANGIESRIREKTFLREFTRIIVKISSEDEVFHRLTWISSDIRYKKKNLINK